MKIKVATRFRPFSHNPGAQALIPGKEATLQMWPTFSEIRSMSNEIIAKGAGANILFQELEKPFQTERLFFGTHKKQDIDLIRRRQDLTEILPIWYKLATFYPSKGKPRPGSLLYELVHEQDRNKLPDRFMKMYLAGLTSFFIPRAEDTEHHGFSLPPVNGDDPLLILTEGAGAIKRMFVEEVEGITYILPHLPSLFHCGRLVEASIPSGSISIEWTKHFLRRVIYTPIEGYEVNIRFPKEVKQYRVKAFGKSFHFDNFRE